MEYKQYILDHTSVFLVRVALDGVRWPVYGFCGLWILGVWEDFPIDGWLFKIKSGKSDLKKKKCLGLTLHAQKGKSNIIFFFLFPLVYMCFSSLRLEFKLIVFMLCLSCVMTSVVNLW